MGLIINCVGDVMEETNFEESLKSTQRHEHVKFFLLVIAFILMAISVQNEKSNYNEAPQQKVASANK